jgi:hypothetical protein
MSSIDNFVSQIDRRGGLARSNRFLVEISNEFDSESISLLCESASIPGKQITTNEYASVKKAEKIPYNYLVEDVTLIFHLTHDYFIKKFFDEWTYKVITKDFMCNYHDEFTKSIDIWQLNKKDKKVYGVKLYGAFPITMNSIELNQNDNESQKLTVVITYEDYTILNASDLVGSLAINLQPKTSNPISSGLLNEINSANPGLPRDLLSPVFSSDTGFA